MPSITVNLTDTEYKGLQYAAVSAEEWVTNAATIRAKTANDEVVQKVVDYCLDNSVQVPATREDIIAYGFSENIVKTAAQLSDDATAALLDTE